MSVSTSWFAAVGVPMPLRFRLLFSCTSCASSSSRRKASTFRRSYRRSCRSLHRSLAWWTKAIVLDLGRSFLVLSLSVACLTTCASVSHLASTVDVFLIRLLDTCVHLSQHVLSSVTRTWSECKEISVQEIVGQRVSLATELVMETTKYPGSSEFRSTLAHLSLWCGMYDPNTLSSQLVSRH